MVLGLDALSISQSGTDVIELVVVAGILGSLGLALSTSKKFAGRPGPGLARAAATEVACITVAGLTVWSFDGGHPKWHLTAYYVAARLVASLAPHLRDDVNALRATRRARERLESANDEHSSANPDTPD